MNKTTLKFLVQLKNSSIFKKLRFKFFYNKQVLSLIRLLYKEGFISSYILKDNFYGELFLKDNFVVTPLLASLSICKKSTRLTSVSFVELCRFSLKGKQLILSTSKGFQTLLNCKKLKIGGHFFIKF